MRQQVGSAISIASWVVCSGVLVGCGGGKDSWEEARPETYPVSGVVTFNGEPLTEAMILFQSNSDPPQGAVGRTDKNGRYRLRTFEEGDGAVAGTHSVLILKQESPTPSEADPRDSKTPPPARSLIPERYSQFETSGLTVEVTEDGAEADFDLTP